MNQNVTYASLLYGSCSELSFPEFSGSYSLQHNYDDATYSETAPILFSWAYFQESLIRIAALMMYIFIHSTVHI